MANHKHVVHIGVHKTGSTWLQRDVFPTVAGATYATGPLFTALTQNLTRDTAFYAETFKAAIAETGKRVLLSWESLAAGDPFGGQNPNRSADRLKSIVPNASIILLTRERESLAHSLYAQYVQEGGVLSEPAFKRSVLSPHYLDMDATIERYRSRFARVLVLPYEQLKERPVPCVQDIAEFTNIKLEIPNQNAYHNVSLRGYRLTLLRKCNVWFRASRHNPTPPVPIPYIGALRFLLQQKLKPR